MSVFKKVNIDLEKVHKIMDERDPLKALAIQLILSERRVKFLKEAINAARCSEDQKMFTEYKIRLNEANMRHKAIKALATRIVLPKVDIDII